MTQLRFSPELKRQKTDLTGRHSGRLFVISIVDDFAENGGIWLCSCACGNVKEVPGRYIRYASVKSCGCINREQLPNLWKTLTKHGLSRSRLYRTYHGMITRCYNMKDNNWQRYGKKGIRICEEWLADKTAFFEWAMANGYQDDLEIDRIDNNGDYEPANCRWVTRTVNANNKSNNQLISTLDGEKHSVAEWSRIKGLGKSVVAARIKYGWSEHDAVSKPKKWISMTFDGQTRSLKEWADLLGVTRQAIHYWLNRGQSHEQTISMFIQRSKDKARESREA